MSEYPDFDLDDTAEQPGDADKAREAVEQDRLAAVDYVMSHHNGRQFVWDLLSDCGVFHTTFAGEQTHHTAFAEGKRQVGLALLTQIEESHPNGYAIMRAEAADRRVRYRNF